MAQRISRAKQRVNGQRRFDAPPAASALDRLVLHVLYLIFNEGYTATLGPELAARRADPRGDPAHPARPPAAARRRRGRGPARADAAHRRAPRRRAAAPTAASSRSPSRTAPAGTPPRSREGVALVDDDARARPRRPLPAPGRDRRRPRRGAARRGHRLAPDRRALRPPRAPRPEPDGHAQPRRRRRAWSHGPQAGLAALAASTRRPRRRPPPPRRRPSPPARAGRRPRPPPAPPTAGRPPHHQPPGAPLPRNPAPPALIQPKRGPGPL